LFSLGKGGSANVGGAGRAGTVGWVSGVASNF